MKCCNSHVSISLYSYCVLFINVNDLLNRPDYCWRLTEGNDKNNISQNLDICLLYPWFKMILIGDKWIFFIELPSTFHFLHIVSVQRDMFGNDPTQVNPKLCFDEYLFFTPFSSCASASWTFPWQTCNLLSQRIFFLSRIEAYYYWGSIHCLTRLAEAS